eukprot:7141156-Prymnesium_polylepis.1
MHARTDTGHHARVVHHAGHPHADGAAHTLSELGLHRVDEGVAAPVVAVAAEEEEDVQEEMLEVRPT